MPLPNIFQVDSMYKIEEGGIHIFTNFLNKWYTYLLNECPQGPKKTWNIDYEPLSNLERKSGLTECTKLIIDVYTFFGPNITTCGAHDILMSAPLKNSFNVQKFSGPWGSSLRGCMYHLFGKLVNLCIRPPSSILYMESTWKIEERGIGEPHK